MTWPHGQSHKAGVFVALTSVQQQPHDLKVGVGDTVVEGRVAIPVGEVDDMGEQCWRDFCEGHEVVGNHLRDRGFLAGHSEPLLQNEATAGQLGNKEGSAEAIKCFSLGKHAPWMQPLSSHGFRC